MQNRSLKISRWFRAAVLNFALCLLVMTLFVTTSGRVTAEPAADNWQRRIVQVDLVDHAKVSQFWHIDSSMRGYGKNACGLVAAAAAVGGEQWTKLVDRIADAAGSDYHKYSGIQPSKYAAALQEVLGETNVRVLNETTTDALYRELQAGHVVIVDFKVHESRQVPSAQKPNYAHFARVLGMDMERREIYIENTLGGAPYWTVSLDDFLAAWEYPETTSSLIPDPRRAEDVTRWAVILERGLVDGDVPDEL